MEKIFDLLGKMAKQRHLVALRDGMLAAVPLILVGSTFLLLGSQREVLTNFLPGVAQSAFGQWYALHWGDILVPFRFTMGMLSVYVAFAVAASLAKSYKMPVLPQAMGAVVAFMLTMRPIKAPLEAGGKAQWVIPLAPLGGEGLFLGILCGIFTVELSRFVMGYWDRIFKKKETESADGGNEKMQIPPAVAEAFASFLPILIVATILWVITYTFDIHIYDSIVALMRPLEKLGDTYACVVAVNFFLHIFGFAGLHGVSVINGVFFALWQKFLLVNTEAHMVMQQTGVYGPLPAVTAYPFYQWFVWIGGAGATLPLPFMLMFSRNGHMKKIGRVSVIPSLFNVNEPLLFGLPVVANPILAIPFILSPIVCGCLAFFAFQTGLVTRPFIEVPWVLPAFLGAPLCTQDLRALALLAVNMAVSAFIWLPFLRAYEQRLASQ